MKGGPWGNDLLEDVVFADHCKENREASQDCEHRQAGERK